MKKMIVSFILFFMFIFIFSVELYLYNQANRRDVILEKQISRLSNQVFKIKMERALHKKTQVNQ